MTTVGEQITLIMKAFTPIAQQIGEAMKKFAVVMKKWFPIVSEAHRREVKRVHTMYGRKRKARKRKNRRK